MSELQPKVEDEGEIVVTGSRISSNTLINTVGGWFVHFASFLPVSFLNLSEQPQGEEVARVVSISLINGDVTVRLPGYDYPVIVPAADWARMDEQERGHFVKMMTEFRDSPMLVQTLDNLQAEGAARLIIRFDDRIHRPDGSSDEWAPDRAGLMSAEYLRNADGSLDTSNIKPGSTVIININPAYMPSSGTTPTVLLSDNRLVSINFGWVLAHELQHTFHPGTTDDERQINLEAENILGEILNSANATERSTQDYLDSLTFIGSRYGDVATGSGASDTLAGLSGNDTLNGAAGDDFLLGGGGMDRLTGGTGTNLVMGGLDADTYVPAAGVTLELVSDNGGVDRLDLSRFSIADATFLRYDDTLVITMQSAGETVEVQGQWAGAKVEQFTFAEGNYAASYVEGLAGGGEFVCTQCDPHSPTACDHFAMPVVLDLDGDGLELVGAADSHARFDIDGDGRWERIGWVGADDGILALDRDGNGRIDDFSEISFVGDFLGAATDLEGLFAYDTDGDGFLTKADARFSEFLVWRDANGNGRSEKSELQSLDALSIVSISLERMNLQSLDSDLAENQVLATSVFQTADGRSRVVGDVALFAEPGYGGHAGGGEMFGLHEQQVTI